MPTKINPDYRPRPEDFDALRREGIPAEFIEWELPNFIEYWIERGEQGKSGFKTAWHTTLRKWMRRGFHSSAGAEFERNKERILMNRPRVKQQGDFFQSAVGGLIAQDMPKPEPRRRVYRQPETNIPDMGKMTADEGLDALAEWKARQGRA